MALEKRSPFRLFFVLLFSGIGSFFFFSTLVVPGAVKNVSIPLSIPSLDGRPVAVMPEKRQIASGWQQKMLVGDEATINLSIRIDPQEMLVATATSQEQLSDGKLVVPPDIYSTYNLVVVARLELDGFEVSRSEIQEPLLPGREVAYHWDVRSTRSGRYRGVIWLHLDLVPKDGEPVERVLLLARPIEVEAVTILGLPGNLARWAGLTGILLGIMTGYPFLRKAWNKGHRGRSTS